ncbi:MAG: aldehyde dehydrogenase family protein [Acidobacteriales bacterium]|nr:aldehyde dehydrogenase family protein [Terriglobales bacterium]
MPEVVSMAPPTGCFVAGKWITEGKPVEIHSPYDQSVVGTVSLGNRPLVERAISSAMEAFQVTRKLSSFERQRVLRSVAEQIHHEREELARGIALEAGKPIKTARIEVDRAVFTFSIAAEEATRIGGEWLPMDLQPSAKGMWGIVRHFPLGPLAAITPFNFPLNLVAHKVAPAIASGCTMVLKPASQTPLTALRLARIVENAGWPAGALNVLVLSNEDAAPLVSDERLKALTFTGSAAVGWELKSRAGKKRVTLELGGNAGVIVHDDADINYAAERCVSGGFSYAGQSCISVQRIFVQRRVYDRFLEAFLKGVSKLKTGDPLSDDTDVGPLISERDAVRAYDWGQEAVAAGAKLLAGCKRHGSMLEPTVLTGTSGSMRVQCEEVFAPVKVVEPYDDFTAAVRTINGSRYGLQAGIFTNDARLLFHAYEELEVGGVIAGDVPTFRMDHMPYGGVKDSGMGREGLRYAIEEMTERKLLVMNLR